MDFKFDKAYPPEYAYLGGFVDKANQRLKKMNAVIHRISDKMPDIPFAWPRSEEEVTITYRRARALEYLTNKYYTYRHRILDVVSQETASADPKIRHWVGQSASFGLISFDERDRRYLDEYPEPPTEKMHKLFSELPSIREDETAEQKIDRTGDAITESLSKADEITRLMEETKKRRQANQHRRGGHRR